MMKTYKKNKVYEKWKIKATEYVKNISKDTTKKKVYGEDFIKEFVDMHYRTGLPVNVMERDIGLTYNIAGRWKRKYGKQKTAFVYGKTMRNDVRTKCLAVQEYVERKARIIDLADKYRVTGTTITNWVAKHKDDYLEWLDAPDGIATIAKEESIIFGDDNIHAVMELLENQQQELKELMQNMKKYGINIIAIKQVKNKIKNVDKDIDVMKKAEDIIAKKGKK